MATPAIIPEDVEITIGKQAHDLPDGSKGSLFVKDGEMTKYVFSDAKTIYEAFLRGKKVSDNGNCLGSRSSAETPYQWLSYSQVEERFVTFGAGLASVGVPPGQSTFVAVYGPNCTEWVVADFANLAYSRVTVALYDTLGEEAIAFILSQADIRCVVCSSSNVGKLVSIKSSCPQLSTIVVFNETTEKDKTSAKEVGIELYTMQEIEEKGKNNPIDLVVPKPDDLATICYTSGTTGQPKGVMLTHENLISDVSASCIQTQYQGIPILPVDVHISYLPLAHMYERVVQVNILMNGAQIGFFRGDIKKLIDDIQELKPTMFITVPRLLNRLYDRVMSTVNSSGKIKSWLFKKAYQSKLAETRRGIVRRDSIWDKIVFRKIQGLLGGNVKMILCGSAPVSGAVKEFIRVAFGCHMYEGYGQTEGTAGLTFTFPFDTETGHVGAVLSCARIKLRDVPEMNYMAANGEGEVCFKGPCMTQGYYKNPEKTAELFDEDGWVRTGDVGKWLPNGTLKIIDRVKHIFKLSQGEYIAPEKVENICVRSQYVAQMFLHGDSVKSCCVAIVIPDEEILMAWARNNRRSDATFEDLCKDESVNEMILQDIKAVATSGGLNALEVPKMILLCSELFSIENNLLTPTFKLKRQQVRGHYEGELNSLYNKLEAAN